MFHLACQDASEVWNPTKTDLWLLLLTDTCKTPKNTETHTQAHRDNKLNAVHKKEAAIDRGGETETLSTSMSASTPGTCRWQDQTVQTDPPRQGDAQRGRPEGLLDLTGSTRDKNIEMWHFRRSVGSRREECFQNQSASSKGSARRVRPVTRCLDQM